MDVSCRKTFQGAWVLSILHRGQLVQKQYMGYTKKEAIYLFKQYLHKMVW